MVAFNTGYLLIVESRAVYSDGDEAGYWRFLLKRSGARRALEVSDTEPGLSGERLQLFATIRGLEAIEEPASVTLVTSSHYVIRGIRRDLDTWREMNWTWERFGELHPIKNSDLWRRLDHALRYHQVNCRSHRSMPAAAAGAGLFPEIRIPTAPALSLVY